jgi:ArsR family transcriptional regulator
MIMALPELAPEELAPEELAPEELAPDIADAELDRMVQAACAASNFLKALSHEGRLMILCHLASGEKSVTELEDLLSARQAAVSQQLARLRLEGLVKPRRDGKTVHYSLADERAVRVLEVVYDIFCGQGGVTPGSAAAR